MGGTIRVIFAKPNMSKFQAAGSLNGETIEHGGLGGSVEYLQPIAGQIDGFFYIDTSVVGGSYSSISPTDIYRRYLPAYQIGNVRIGAQKDDETWSACFFINNIADSVAIVSSSTSSNTPGQTLVYSVPPRTFGINLNYKFR